MNKYILLLIILFCSIFSKGQTTFTNGMHSIELSGSISVFGNVKWMDTAVYKAQKFHDDRMNLRDMQIQLEGRHQKGYEWKFQTDIADMITDAGDPENPGLMDAWVEIQKLLPINIKVGWQKVPYARSNQVSFTNSQFWSRAEVAKGDYFSRRDVGITLNKTFLRQTIALYLGAYSGQGETILSNGGNNDENGKFEYIARAEFAYPSRFRYQDIDRNVSPIPMFFLGVNGRFAQKTAVIDTKYLLKNIDGKKRMVGADFAFQYRGFSVQGEGHAAQIEPNSQGASNGYGVGVVYLSDGKLATFSRSYGAFLQAAYYVKNWKSVFSTRYEYFDPNDLKSGDEISSIVGAYNYEFNGRRSAFKLQYWHMLKKSFIDASLNNEAGSTSKPFKWTDQLRLGYQFLF